MTDIVTLMHQLRAALMDFAAGMAYAVDIQLPLLL